MKQSIFTSTILCTALVLTACGGSDDNTSNAGGTSNPPPNANAPIQNGVLNYSVFDIYHGDNQPKSGWGRLDYVLGNGTASETISTVVGTPTYQQYLGQYQNLNSDYRIGKGYFSQLADKENLKTLAPFIKAVDGNSLQVTYPNTNLSETLTFTPIDLSGKGQNAPKAVQGIFTDLDDYRDYFKGINYSFPKGASCYVVNSKTNLPSYYFYDGQSTDDKDLPSWVASQSKSNLWKNDQSVLIQVNNVVYEAIGKNNDIPAVHFQDQFGDYHAAVLHQGKVMQAEYTDGINYLTPVENADPAKGKVNCATYNKVAADYLAEQMKLSYSQQ